MEGLLRAFLMLGLTEVLQQKVRRCFRNKVRSAVLLRLNWSLGCVGQHDVDEDGGAEEYGAHHGEGKDEAPDFIESTADHWAHYFPWGIISLQVQC